MHVSMMSAYVLADARVAAKVRLLKEVGVLQCLSVGKYILNKGKGMKIPWIGRGDVCTSRYRELSHVGNSQRSHPHRRMFSSVHSIK